MENILLLIQIALVDLSLAGDNAIVVGMAASSLPAHQRKKAIAYGLSIAVCLRIAMAFFASQLLQIAGLLVAGGILLLWVCWKMWREVRASENRAEKAAEAKKETSKEDNEKKFVTIMMEITIADLSMSLDNVLGVAGVARDHKYILAIGLILSIGMVGLASTAIAKFAERFPKIAYVGVAIVLYVALRMIYDGAHQLMHSTTAIA